MSYTITLDKERLCAFIQSDLYNKQLDYAPLLFKAIELKDCDGIALS